MSNSYGVNKASDRKALKAILTTVGLVAFFAAVVGEKRNSEVTGAIKALGFNEFLDCCGDVLRSQTSGSRGRPALEEKPIHTMLKAMRSVSKLASEADAKALLSKALKVASEEEVHLQTRRAIFKPSKRVQGTRRLPGLLNAGENAKA
jgi:hypothetical protein